MKNPTTPQSQLEELGGMLIAVGQPNPLPMEWPGHDGTFVNLTSDTYLNVVVYLANPQPDEIRAIEKGKITYTIFDELAIPFPLFSFGDSGNMLAEGGINMLLCPEKVRAGFIDDHTRNTCMIILCDEFNVVRAMRFIGLDYNFTKYLNHILNYQLQVYTSPAQVEKNRQMLMQRHTSAEMFTMTLNTYTLPGHE